MKTVKLKSCIFFNTFLFGKLQYCSLCHPTYILSLKIGNWDRGTSLEKVVKAASELRVPGLLQVSVFKDQLGELMTC